MKLLKSWGRKDVGTSLLFQNAPGENDPMESIPLSQHIHCIGVWIRVSQVPDEGLNHQPIV